MDAAEILTYINTGGIVAVLVWMVHLGLTGKVVPRDLLDEVISSVVREVLRELNGDNSDPN